MGPLSFMLSPITIALQKTAATTARAARTGIAYMVSRAIPCPERRRSVMQVLGIVLAPCVEKSNGWKRAGENS